MMDGQISNKNCELLINLPFFNLPDSELNALIGNWDYVFTSDLDIYNVIQNPDRFDERDSDLMLCALNSEYYSLPKLNQLFDKYCSSDNISLFHFNIRSLPKNISILNDFLYTLNSRPDILAITETKQSNNTVVNVDLHNYNFFHTDSPTMAGGAGLYISNELQSIYWPDIKFSMPLVESCWSEIISGKNKPNVVVGCIYRHPTANLQEFSSELDSIIKQLNTKKH
jgi:hypothetical protein